MPSPPVSPAVSRRHAARLAGGVLAAAITVSRSGSAEAAETAVLDANKALVRRLFSTGINGDNREVFAELYADGAVDHQTWTRAMPGPAGMPLTLDQFRAEFPDVTVTADAVVAEADLVATRETWWGAHPPAGKHVVGQTMHVFRIASGQIFEQWSVGWEWLAQREEPRVLESGNPLLVP